LGFAAARRLDLAWHTTMNWQSIRRKEFSEMAIQSWIIAGLIVGWLVGMVMGRHDGFLGDIILGIISGLVGGSLASILFIVAGAANGGNVVAAIFAFTGAAILLTMKRVVNRSRSV
jgi:uncharacterized membrane protein YeaQ/YmgE (transglycosylase-associated protein family)